LEDKLLEELLLDLKKKKDSSVSKEETSLSHEKRLNIFLGS